MDDVLINKASIIEKCLIRVSEEYSGHETEFLENFTKQDSVILNIQRAIQAAVDMATHIVRVKKLGIPQNSAESFSLLEDDKLIDKDLSLSLQKMIGFRNIAVHDYQKLDLDIVVSVIEKNLIDLQTFKSTILTTLA